MSGDHISGPTLFRGAGGGNKSKVKFPAMYFAWLIRRRSSKKKYIFQVVLARIVDPGLFLPKIFT